VVGRPLGERVGDAADQGRVDMANESALGVVTAAPGGVVVVSALKVEERDRAVTAGG